MKIFIKGKAKAQRIRGMGEHFNAAFLKICLFKPYRGLSILCSLGGLLLNPLTKKSRILKNLSNVKEGILEEKGTAHRPFPTVLFFKILSTRPHRLRLPFRPPAAYVRLRRWLPPAHKRRRRALKGRIAHRPWHRW